MKPKELISKLTNAKIRFKLLNSKFLLYAADKPESMTWPMFQFWLKKVARFNQNNKCICGEKPTDLHHALITRKTVQGNKECKNLIHCSLNVIEVCKECHLSINRHESAAFLADIFDRQFIVDWYNSVDDKMVSELTRIEYYLPNWCATCGKECDDEFCSVECSKYETLD